MNSKGIREYSMIDIRDIVQYIVWQLVEDPAGVKVTAEGEEIRVLVKKSDMGRVIGKQGKIAKAIRTVVRAAGMRHNQKCNVEIDEIPE